jgi:iron complex transport system permease protein
MGGLTAARLWAVLSALLVLLLLVACLGLLVGPFPLDLGIALSGELGPNPHHAILFSERLPRLWLATLVGASLAAVGAAFQALVHNPLAEPFALGTSGGAALAATVALVSGAGALRLGQTTVSTVPLFAFLGAAAALLLVRALSGDPSRQGAHRLLLLGVVFNFFASAAITFIKTVVDTNKARELLFWLVGGLSLESFSLPELVLATAAVLLGVGILWRLSPALNALSLGDDGASALGFAVPRVRRHTVWVSSLLVGVAVSLSGLVGFVGLVVPHALRALLGADLRLLLPASAVAGAAFLAACDALSRALFSPLGSEVPVGAVTAFVGAPLFAWLLVRDGRAARGDHG